MARCDEGAQVWRLPPYPRQGVVFMPIPPTLQGACDRVFVTPCHKLGSVVFPNKFSVCPTVGRHMVWRKAAHTKGAWIAYSPVELPLTGNVSSEERWASKQAQSRIKTGPPEGGKRGAPAHMGRHQKGTKRAPLSRGRLAGP